MEKQYENLIEENKKLKLKCEELIKENIELKKKLGLLPKVKEINHESESRKNEKKKLVNGINKYSSPKEKIELFLHLFNGREDVFARRWESKNGKSGYSPACSNEWKRGVCNKPKTKCSECSHRKLTQYNEAIVQKHLSGKEVVGIYALLKDETCNFLAVDFDKKSWMEDVKAFRETLLENEIPIAVERSRSGNGAHIWIFFKEPIKASEARKFGTCLLTATMEKRYEIGLESYDRLFPNQDTMPKGGFGNLIALPLQKKARNNGNSEFVDEDFNSYEDQWFYLSKLKKVAIEKVEEILKIAEEKEKLDYDDSKEENSVSENTFIKKKIEVTELPDKVNIKVKNMIYIEKKDLPSSIINTLIRTAAFSNPEFYRAQALRLSTYNKPRLINCSENDSEYLILPRGCLENVERILNEYQINIIKEDSRFYGNEIKVEFMGKLTDPQLKAGKSMLQYDNGVLCATTGFGKTVLAAWMIGERKVNTLIIVHRKQLMEQWKDRISVFLGINRKNIGEIGGGKSKTTGVIDIAIIQSLYVNREVKDLVKEYGHVIVDECHHLSAFSFESVLKKVNAKYVLGLTATPIRKDGHHPIITMQCGPIRHKVNYKDISNSKSIKHIVLERNTKFQYDEYVEKKTKITDIYSAIIEDKARNDMIFNDVLDALENKKSPIILTERTAHIEYLQQRFKGFVKNLIILRGGMGKKQRMAAMKQLESIPEDEERLIIASGKYVGEGFDDERLDTLFLVMPISWKGTLQQYVGRLHRDYANKEVVMVYDYVDEKVPMLKRMYQKRVKGYKNIGYKFTNQ